MDRKMKKVAAAILCVFALMSVTAAVYAYLQDAIERTNRIVIGEGKVKVDETFTTPPSLQMSNTFVKVVTVKNTGTSDQYVRTFLDEPEHISYWRSFIGVRLLVFIQYAPT